MAMNGDGSVKDDQKTRFTTREGVYGLMPLIEYYRPNRSNFSSVPIPLNSVHLSLVSIPGSRDYPERLCLNIGKELYIYLYKGVKSGADMVTQIEKKSFKTMNPTCHNFNEFYSSPESVPLLVGFNTGIVTLQDLIRKDIYKVFNEEKLVDNTKVTCIQWIPNSKHLFLTSHASGQLYLYNEELPCSTSPPNYQLFKNGDGYAIHVCKTKSTRNPLYRWVIGCENSSINQFAFSPCHLYLAVVSQDGFLRVFHYDTMELVGIARSYFGGLLCVCWSPDSKYVAVGGEDDLVTIWSFHEKQIIARGQGHHSWINVVSFDPFTSSIPPPDQSPNSHNFSTCYRLGSVGQDTQLCLWDLTEDVLRQPIRFSSINIKMKSNECSNNGEAFNMASSNHVGAVAVHPHGNHVTNHIGNNNNNNNNNNSSSSKDNQSDGVTSNTTKHSPPSLTQKLVLLSFIDRRDCSGSTTKKFSSRNNSGNCDKYGGCGSRHSELEDPMKLIGTAACPRFDQCPLLEPLICKKISNERLSALVFKEDCILTSCYDGSVYTWARPGKVVSMHTYNVHVPEQGETLNITGNVSQASITDHHLATVGSMSANVSNDSNSTVV